MKKILLVILTLALVCTSCQSTGGSGPGYAAPAVAEIASVKAAEPAAAPTPVPAPAPASVAPASPSAPAPAAPAVVAKYCALTFDDGPDPAKTVLVLQKLEKYGVPATFFLVGSNVTKQTQAVMIRALEDGCEFGNHSWSWNSMNTMTEAQIKDSVAATSEAIRNLMGVTPKFFRPPNLATGGAMAAAIDMPFISGVLGNDWSGMNTSAEQRAQLVLGGVRDGAIILLHDVQPAPHPTPEALDILIPELKARGYVFLTLSQLFEKKGVTPALHDGQMWVYVE
jgi:peptidoglycan-N-acetylglucosamine deacetylase